ncbi:hypothetical protein HPG69_014992, partial [Diceros bicornis minor]
SPSPLTPHPLSALNPRSPPAATLEAQPLPSDCFLCRPRHRLLKSFALLETLSLRGAGDPPSLGHPSTGLSPSGVEESVFSRKDP